MGWVDCRGEPPITHLLPLADDEKTKAKKRKLQKGFKSKTRFARMDLQQKQKAESWRNFMSGKGESAPRLTTRLAHWAGSLVGEWGWDPSTQQGSIRLPLERREERAPPHTSTLLLVGCAVCVVVVQHPRRRQGS